MRVFFTGGAGKAGRHVVPYLAQQGHRVLNADLVKLGHPGVHDLRVDLTDMGQVYSALTSRAGFDELDGQRAGFDAVVHFAAVPAILQSADVDCYHTNVLSTYNVLEAALALGIRKVIFASSETTYGVCFAQGEVLPDYIPVDEDHPTLPHDSYALSKVCNEITGRGFQARTGADIYGLRINNVIEPHEYEQNFPAYVKDAGLRRRNIFGYIDARDLGHMVDRCLKTDGLGYEVFNVSNDDSSVGMPSQEVIRKFYQGVDVKTPISGHQTFYSNAKAKKLLGYAPQHGWRHLPGLK